MKHKGASQILLISVQGLTKAVKNGLKNEDWNVIIMDEAHRSATAAVVIRSLFDKGYLEVGEIKYSQSVLARAYRPTIPFIDFIKGECGETAVEKLVNHAISSLMTKQQTEYFSNLINERKNMINKNMINKNS